MQLTMAISHLCVQYTRKEEACLLGEAAHWHCEKIYDIENEKAWLQCPKAATFFGLDMYFVTTSLT